MNCSTIQCSKKPVLRNRVQRGSSMAELPGALIILLFVIFFPLINIIGLGIKYGGCATLNGIQLREAALVPRSQAIAAGGAVQKGIPDQWLAGGIGKFVNPTVAPHTEITYRDGEKTDSGVDKLVTVKTTVSIPPFITVPFLPDVPGLSAPVQFTLEGERPMENPFNYDS